MDKTAMVGILGWDKGVNGWVTYEGLKVEGNAVSALFTETNEFLQLIGIGELKTTNTYEFNEEG